MRLQLRVRRERSSLYRRDGKLKLTTVLGMILTIVATLIALCSLIVVSWGSVVGVSKQESDQKHVGRRSNSVTNKMVRYTGKVAGMSSTAMEKVILEGSNENRVSHTIEGGKSLELEPSYTQCEYAKVVEMKSDDRRPMKGARHTVTPPPGPIILVCCQTTSGTFNVAVHPKWAPLGSERFLAMVRSGYFSSRVALMRCVKNFLCQFGIAGMPSLNKDFFRSLRDDPNWLPEGPDHRVNEDGVKRFAKGYLAYAGSGPNSRSNQLIVSLAGNRFLGGGSPWEVPFGEVVGPNSFRTLDKVYTGYGESGPSQRLLRKEGSSRTIAEQFPLLDYITACDVVDEEE